MSMSSFRQLAIELLFQVLVFILQVPDGLLEGVNVLFILIILSIGSGEDARVDVCILTFFGVEIILIMVIHVCVHMHSVALASVTSACVKDDSFTVNPPSPDGGRAGADTSSLVLIVSSRVSARADGFFHLARA